MRKYRFSPPPEGEGGTVNPPRITLLRELIGRSSASLLGRMDIGLDVPGSGSGPGLANKKRKVVTSKVANSNNNGRSNSSWGLVQTIADKTIARQACVYSASGRACPRNDCFYEHGQKLGSPPSPSPSLSPLPLPPSLSQPPQQQQQPPQQQQQPQRNNGAHPAAASSGNGGVAMFSYHYPSCGTPDGRGGGTVEDPDRATEPLVDVVRGVRDDGTGPAAQRGRQGGIAEWGPL